MKFRWNYSEVDDRSIFDQIISNREIKDSFIYANFEDIPSYKEMKDMEKAADRIIEAVRLNQKIMIYGHDDVDGITATYILFDFLEKVGFQNHYYYIPNRLLENHGIPISLVQRLIQDKFDLLVTVDGGISEFSNVDDLAELGIDVVITDHHLVQNKIPAAYAVVNPKQTDCHFPDDMLAGVTVSYFLVLAIADKLEMEIDENYLFWVALGSIADKVPVMGVNRLILKEVLDKWFLYDDPALEALKPYLVAAPNYDKRIKTLKYIVRLLSNGRQPFGEHKALYYLLAPVTEKEIILQNLVREQREYDERINKVRSFLRENIQIQNENCIVFFDKENKLEVNMFGFAASQLSSQHKIPVVMLKRRDDVITGEARATKGFCLITAFKYCQDLLIQFGGHSRAAGFTAQPELIEKFSQRFKEYVQQQEDDIKFYQKLSVDAVFSMEDIDKFYLYLQTDYHVLQPFGQGNRNPTFLLKNYCPARDWKKIKLKDSINELENDKAYDILFKFKGSSFWLVDYRDAIN